MERALLSALVIGEEPGPVVSRYAALLGLAARMRDAGLAALAGTAEAAAAASGVRTGLPPDDYAGYLPSGFLLDWNLVELARRHALALDPTAARDPEMALLFADMRGRLLAGIAKSLVLEGRVEKGLEILAQITSLQRGSALDFHILPALIEAGRLPEAESLVAAYPDSSTEAPRAALLAAALLQEGRLEAVRCSIPDDHIDPRRRALFVARSILGEVRDGGRAC